ncbi:hypothetical protein DPK31_05660 [Salmonella enterica subsp. enterica serovar Umbilo]|nr:hypothetical protein [Salmonella enterica subsp. enterica serovar Umbilo]
MNIFLTSLVSILRKALPRVRHAVVNKRCGWINPRHERAVDCGEFDSFHCAMNTAYRQALELAHLRYAWELTD